MTSVRDHRDRVAQEVSTHALDSAPLDFRALGRRLGADLIAADDLPRFDDSAMDGYAVHPGPDDPLGFAVLADVPAGSVCDLTLEPGQAVRVMTGAPVPAGSVAVVPVECTDADPTGAAPTTVRITEPVQPGRHIRRRGEQTSAGSLIAPAGAEITPAVIAAGRSAGVTTVTMAPRTRVAVISTGDELTEAGQAPERGGIHESNSDMVAALATAAGCEVVAVERCGDSPHALGTLIDRLLDTADFWQRPELILTTGGISQGAFEVVRQWGNVVGGFTFDHVDIAPGGPQGIGRYRDVPVVCLPGTPSGGLVAWYQLIEPILAAQHGRPARESRQLTYRGETLRNRSRRARFLPATDEHDGTVRADPGRGLTPWATADSMIELPSHTEALADGASVTVWALSR